MNIRPRRPRRNALVDMTPLIDVVFLLLIFFMVSTTFDRQTQLKVNLPEAGLPTEEQAPPKEIAITVDRQGRYYLDGQELVSHDLETLQRALRKASQGNSELPVRVTADRQAPFQAVVRVMDAAGRLGMEHLSFLTRADDEAR